MNEIEILLGTYNGEKYLNNQLKTISAQRQCKWSLIVSDDGSSDKTVEIVSRFQRTVPNRVTIQQGPCGGVAQNYLHLLKHAESGCDVALADQDDLWLPGKLARAQGIVSKFPSNEPVVYAGKTYLLRQNKTLQPPCACRLSPSFQNSLVQNVLAGNTIFMNAQAAKLLRDHLPRTCPPYHDWWIYSLLSAVGARIIIDDVPQAIYRQHEQAQLGARYGFANMKKRKDIVWSGYANECLNKHLEALESVFDLFTKKSQNTFRKFLKIHRDKHGIARAVGFLTIGVHRQAALGTLGVAAAMALGVIKPV